MAPAWLFRFFSVTLIGYVAAGAAGIVPPQTQLKDMKIVPAFFGNLKISLQAGK